MISLRRLATSARFRCCYCGCATFIAGEPRRQVMARIGANTRRQYRYRLATREHVTRVSEGGTDGRHNLTLACLWCNSNRQDHEPEIWAIVVAGIVAVGRHPCHPLSPKVIARPITQPIERSAAHA